MMASCRKSSACAKKERRRLWRRRASMADDGAGGSIGPSEGRVRCCGCTELAGADAANASDPAGALRGWLGFACRISGASRRSDEPDAALSSAGSPISITHPLRFPWVVYFNALWLSDTPQHTGAPSAEAKTPAPTSAPLLRHANGAYYHAAPHA